VLQGIQASLSRVLGTVERRQLPTPGSQGDDG
jgi:hypothetical protein